MENWLFIYGSYKKEVFQLKSKAIVEVTVIEYNNNGNLPFVIYGRKTWRTVLKKSVDNWKGSSNRLNTR